ncbi:MAG: TRIC cation channel family protein [Clostridia bacterium]|nr:TRIC cation channel family protein [Clostridia bacterium]
MTPIELTVYLLALIGTGACSVSGAAAAIRKRLDLFGVFIVSAITGLGGGILRDVLLSNLPPAMFRDPNFILVITVVSVTVFLVAKFSPNYFRKDHHRLGDVLNVVDAVGLGAFTVLGINTALNMGFRDNAFFLVFLGLTTGVGGGVLRDITLREIPSIFTKHVYAIAALAGAILYVVMFLALGLSEILSVFSSMALVIVLRILATCFRWNFPKAF